MEIKLNDQEIKDILLSALCNAGHFHYGDMSLKVEARQYAAARLKLQEPCREDVWMQILLDGGRLILVDNEDESLHIFSLEKAKNAIEKLPAEIISDFVEGNDDSDTADWVLEYIMYGEKIYG
jgi:hypothetical protein